MFFQIFSINKNLHRRLRNIEGDKQGSQSTNFGCEKPSIVYHLFVFESPSHTVPPVIALLQILQASWIT